MRFKSQTFGKYYLLDRIAVGGTAEIFKAKSFGAEGFEKILAIKRILPHLARNKDFIKMLIDEAKIAVQLTHKNIVQVYDLGKVDDDYFIAMEYIEGMNLRTISQQLRKMKRRLPLKDALLIVSEICRGLDYAHRKKDHGGKLWKIVHRDISPPNVLISIEGEVKIIDFGIAKAESKITETLTGVLKGKLAYMSPEQARCEDVDYRSDIFSTGIILYELVTHKNLFKRDSGLKSLERIKKFNIDPEFLPSDMPKELRLILLRALQKNPAKRYQNAKELESDIKRYMISTSLESNNDNLAQIIQEIFRKEIKSKKLGKFSRDISLDEKTINLISTAKQEMLVTTQFGAPTTDFASSFGFSTTGASSVNYAASESSDVSDLNPRNVHTYIHNTHVMTPDGNIEFNKNKPRPSPKRSIADDITSLFRFSKIHKPKKNRRPPPAPKKSINLKPKTRRDGMEDMLHPQSQKQFDFGDSAPSPKMERQQKNFLRPQKEGHFELDISGPSITLESAVFRPSNRSSSETYEPYADADLDGDPTLYRRVRSKSPFQEIIYRTFLLFSIFFLFFAGAYYLPKILYFLRQLFLPFFN